MPTVKAYITLNNPGKANIMDKATSDEISAAWTDLWEDRDVRCAILTGAGDKHFCGGHNLGSEPAGGWVHWGATT